MAIVSESVIGAALLATFLLAGYQVDTNTIIVFCRGYNLAMGAIFREYRGIPPYLSNVVFGMWCFVTLIPFVELGIYIDLFWHLNDHDKETEQNGLMPREAINQRRRRNIVTLSGQAFAFCIEAGFGFIISMMYLIPDDILDASLHPILSIMLTTATAVAHFMASPELRRFYFPGHPNIHQE